MRQARIHAVRVCLETLRELFERQAKMTIEAIENKLIMVNEDRDYMQDSLFEFYRTRIAQLGNDFNEKIDSIYSRYNPMARAPLFDHTEGGNGFSMDFLEMIRTDLLRQFDAIAVSENYLFRESRLTDLRYCFSTERGRITVRRFAWYVYPHRTDMCPSWAALEQGELTRETSSMNRATRQTCTSKPLEPRLRLRSRESTALDTSCSARMPTLTKASRARVLRADRFLYLPVSVYCSISLYCSQRQPLERVNSSGADGGKGPYPNGACAAQVPKMAT